MSYLGNAPARSFISFERQVFTIVNSQTAYTLSHSVTNENDIRLVVNNVVQEPGSGKAYTATGTTLTLSAALTNGTDEMYCVFLGRATATNAPGAGSVGTAQLAADSVTNAKIADDAISDEQLDPTVITGQTAETSIATDDLILLSDTSASGALKKMTRANFVSGVGGVNTPAFYAYSNAPVDLSDATWTNYVFNTEQLDTGNGYNTSDGIYTVPSGEGGTWIFGAAVRPDCTNGALARAYMYGEIDGSDAWGNASIDFQNGAGSAQGTGATMFGYLVRTVSAGATVRMKVYCDVTTGNARIDGSSYEPTYFFGYKLIT